MRISARIKPNSKKEAVETAGNNEIIIRVNAPARDGRANERMIELLSEYFNTPKSAIIIVRGYKSKNKLIEINK